MNQNSRFRKKPKDIKLLKIFRVHLAIFVGICQGVSPAQSADLERKMKEKEMADRIAFEEELAKKRLAQKEEDERRAALRQQQQAQIPKQQPPSQTPQSQIHQDGNHRDGKALASSLMSGVVSAARSTDPRSVPGFETDKPQEASLKAEALGEAALKECKESKISQYVISSAKDRPKFKIDPSTDPLLKDAHEAIKDPQKTLDEEFKAESDSDEILEAIRTCEEGGDEYVQRCQKRLIIEFKITPAHKIMSPYCPGHYELSSPISRTYAYRGHCAGCHKREVDVPEKVELIREEWVDDCLALEELTEKGLCRYVSLTKSPHNETRMIQGQRVARDHFEEQYVYACFKSSLKSCTALREQGCYQVNSVCKERISDQCVLWEQTYSCPLGKRSPKLYQTSHKTSLFCLGGNCADASYEANGELLSVMSHLYALREAQEDLKSSSVIFRGQKRWCTRNCLDFRDCCGSSKGWGVTIHLSSCDAAEIELRTLRDKNLCVQVGTYCAERDKVFKSCLRKKTTFCCYGTKLARLIQENGRAQLGLGWGTSEHPICERGFSPEELSRIDFSKINFSEIFEDIKSQTVAKGQDQSLAMISSERLQDNMTLLAKPSFDGDAPQKLQAIKEKGF